MSHTLRLSLIGAVMTGFLALMLGQNLIHRSQGTEVLVPVEGYDPRDILLGHYANIRTPLHRLESGTLDAGTGFDRGDRIFVLLDTGPTGQATAIGIQAERPEGGLYMEGRVRSDHVVPGDIYRVDYNIERYFSSQERALALQDRLRERNADGETGISLILALNRNGAAQIKGFVVDGERRVDRVW